MMFAPLPIPIAFAAAALVISSSANSACWGEAEREYAIPVSVLKAVAKTESSMNPKAIGRNAKSTDLGLMQINDGHLPRLKKYGIDREVLLNDPCINLMVGASILRESINRYGFNWNAIGAYNVGCAKLPKEECAKRRNRYAWKVYRAYASLSGSSAPAAQAAPQSRATTYLSFASDATMEEARYE